MTQNFEDKLDVSELFCLGNIYSTHHFSAGKDFPFDSLYLNTCVSPGYGVAALQELGGGGEDKVGDTGVGRQGGLGQVWWDVDDTNLCCQEGNIPIRS